MKRSLHWFMLALLLALAGLIVYRLARFVLEPDYKPYRIY